MGTPFLVAVEPHGSRRIPNGKAGFFVTIPSMKTRGGNTKITRVRKVILPYLSTPRLSTMVYLALNIQQNEDKIKELKNQAVKRIEG